MINIIPKPIKATVKDKKIVIDKHSTITSIGKFATAVDFFKIYVKKSIGKTLTESANGDGNIVFIYDEKIVKEGYIIKIENDKLYICASHNCGAFYAVQTLRQICRLEVNSDVSQILIGEVYIEDAPRYSWRGLMLDESRHFFGIDEVKRILDLMAMHKLNVFHWHLSDDQGWRIEIKQYPKLTQVGSKRKDTGIHGWRSTDMLGEPYEGFYTQEQIKEIVDYADKRCIMVVPEIDMPAHFAAAMASYNWLGCREIPCEVAWYYGGKVPESLGMKDWNRSACVGKESTYDFIKSVIDECCELFPSPYFHVGGDEAPKDEWKKCEHCQKVMEENNLNNVDELHGYFNNRIYNYLKTKNKKMIGWNEILAGHNLDNEVICQYWVPTRDKNVEKYLNNGGKAILSKHQSFYFDMCYSQYPLKNTYKFNLKQYKLSRKVEKNILGVEGEVWTEFIDCRKKLDVTLFPRMEALAEVGWTMEKNIDFDDFLVRLSSFKKLLEHYGVWYAEDEVSMPKNIFKRKAETEIWHSSDQHRDVQLNELAKKKLGKE